VQIAVEGPMDRFAESLASLLPADVPFLYGFASAWAGWVQSNRDNWDALATIARVEAAMNRSVELDESYDEGGAHLYLGVIATRLPAHLGGRQEEGRAHFERAIELSGGRNLLAKVLFARHYARQVFDRELHDRLLREVLAAEPETPGFTLMNLFAQREAVALLAGSEEYF